MSLPRATVDPETRVRVPSWPTTANAHLTDQLIVRLKVDETESVTTGTGARRNVMAASRARQLSLTAGTPLNVVRQMSNGSHVLKLTGPMALDQAQEIADRLARDPAVASVQPDGRRHAMQAVPINDTRFAEQWNLASPTTAVTGPFPGGTLPPSLGGVNIAGAYNADYRGQWVRVAVIDSGVIFTNQDLFGRVTAPPTTSTGFIAASGYDLVSPDSLNVFGTANDGNGRDNDASDPGNWITAAEASSGGPGGAFLGCPTASNSDWHGTHIAGIIAARADNGFGTVGVASQALITSVRALGKCGGYTSDVADGIRWAAGLGIAGVPTNTEPAQVLNLSLGGAGPCSAEEQSAINDALQRGSAKAIVVAAGNSNGTDVANESPASCQRVITVAAAERNGVRAAYSNIGAGVEVTAPGGNFSSACFNAQTPGACGDGILSSFNNGVTTPTSDGFAFVIGTSEAAAHVSGVAAIVLSVNRNLTRAQVAKTIIESARRFPTGSNCSTAICGAGLVDATAAAMLARTPPADEADWRGINFTAVTPPVTTPPVTTPPVTTPPVTTPPVTTPPATITPPTTVAATETSTTAATAVAATDGGGGGGGGGCVTAVGGHADLSLAMLLLGAGGMVYRRRRVTRQSLGTSL